MVSVIYRTVVVFSLRKIFWDRAGKNITMNAGAQGMDS